jgi:hypothetical protein
VDWRANVLRRNALPPSQSSWFFHYPFCRKTRCNRVLERSLLIEGIPGRPKRTIFSFCEVRRNAPIGQYADDHALLPDPFSSDG